MFRTLAVCIVAATLTTAVLAQGNSGGGNQGNGVGNGGNGVRSLCTRRPGGNGMGVNGNGAGYRNARRVQCTDDALTSEAVLQLEVSDTRTVVLATDHVEMRGGGANRFTWIGNVAGDGGDAVIAVQDGAVWGTIVGGDATYQLHTAADGDVYVLELDESTRPPDAEPLAAPSSASSNTRRSVLAARADDGSQIDLLVAYTPEAHAATGGASGMVALIALAETETNQIYANSGVSTRVSVVHTHLTTHPESGASMHTLLSRVRSTTDGWFDEVHGVRDAHAADAVVLLTAPGAYCGVAYLWSNFASSFASSAFGVVSTSCATGYYSFAHELGHNQGCHHDPVTTQGATGIFSYSVGYRNTNAQPPYRSVMSYNCPGGCSRHKFFSTPANTCNGWITGTAAQDNARTINEVATAFSNFRVSANPTTPAPTPQPTPNPTPQPVTPAPTPAPVQTPQPTPNPTPQPVTPAPTPQPTPNPTPQPVTPTPNPTPQPTAQPVAQAPVLTLWRQFKHRGRHRVRLRWSYSGSATFTVYRNGNAIGTTTSKRYNDYTSFTQPATYHYEVCVPGACSNVVTATFT